LKAGVRIPAEEILFSEMSEPALEPTQSDLIYDMIYLLTAIGLTPGGSSTVHIYTQTIHRTTKKIHRTQKNTQNNKKQYIEQHKKIHRTTKKQYTEQHKNKLEQCGPCPVLVSYTLAFAL
jgi:hypothetical protein